LNALYRELLYRLAGRLSPIKIVHDGLDASRVQVASFAAG
jgi:hypothetical protein